MKIKEINTLIKMSGYTKDFSIFEYRLKNYGVEDRNLKLLWKIYKLILFTDYVPDKIRDTFKNPVKVVARKYHLSEGTIKKEVYDFFNQNIARDITNKDGIIYDIIDNKVSDEDLNIIEKVVDELLKNSNYVENILYNNFSIDIFDNVEYNGHNIEDDEFEKIRNKLVYFSIPWQLEQLKMVDKNQLGYIKYILTHSDEKLEKIDIDRKKELLAFLRISKGE